MIMNFFTNLVYQSGGLYQVKNSVAQAKTKSQIYCLTSFAFFQVLENQSPTIFLNIILFINIF